jgi:hypothetical protein
LFAAVAANTVEKTNCAYLQRYQKQLGFLLQNLIIEIPYMYVYDGQTTNTKIHQVFIIIFPAFFDLGNQFLQMGYCLHEKH